jgi:hypothetical protein
VLAAGVSGGGHGDVEVLAVDDDDQGEHPTQGHGADVAAEGDELAPDVAGRGAGEVDDQGILQRRPSRRIISWAEGGPQPPES